MPLAAPAVVVAVLAWPNHSPAVATAMNRSTAVTVRGTVDAILDVQVNVNDGLHSSIQGKNTGAPAVPLQLKRCPPPVPFADTMTWLNIPQMHPCN